MHCKVLIYVGRKTPKLGLARKVTLIFNNFGQLVHTI